MTTLSDRDIIETMKAGLITIDPFEPKQINPNSYDVRLGNQFYFVNWHYRRTMPLFHGPIYIDDGEPVFIPRNGTLLGLTKEVVGTFGNVFGEIRGKSSTRRIGISVCSDAGFGDVGFHNAWTVELSAHVTDGSPSLIVGQAFAQIAFHRTETAPSNPYTGQYNAADIPECMIPKRFRLDGFIRPADEALLAEVKQGWL